MKKFYLFLLLFSGVVLVRAQTSYDREFSSFADSTTFSNNSGQGAVDFIFSMPDTGFLIVSCLAKTDPYSFLQLWLANFNIQPNPYIMTCVSSDAAVNLKIDATYVDDTPTSFGSNPLTGGGAFDTLLYQGLFNKNLKQLMIDVSAAPCVLTFDWFRMGAAGHPIQASVPASPKVLPASACTLKISNLFYFYEKTDPISKLVCTASCSSSYVSDIKVEEDPTNNAFNIIFNTGATTKSQIAFFDITIKSTNNAHTRTWNVAVNITPSAGNEEMTTPEFKLYPVPASDMLTVELPDDKGYQLSVLNMAGTTVLSRTIAPGVLKTELNISGLAAGSYTLVVSNRESLIGKKFVKK